MIWAMITAMNIIGWFLLTPPWNFVPASFLAPFPCPFPAPFLHNTNTITITLLNPPRSPTHLSTPSTAILVSKEAAAKGVGSMTTHTNDCLDCDFRLAKVPAMDHPEGSMRKIWGGRAQYPRYIGDDRGDVYYKEKIVPGLYDWDTTEAVGYIPQVAHTYAYLDGDYGIQNEHQLSMGESTCGGRAELAHAPTFDGGDALLEMSEVRMEMDEH